MVPCSASSAPQPYFSGRGRVVGKHLLSCRNDLRLLLRLLLLRTSGSRHTPLFVGAILGFHPSRLARIRPVVSCSAVSASPPYFSGRGRVVGKHLLSCRNCLRLPLRWADGTLLLLLLVLLLHVAEPRFLPLPSPYPLSIYLLLGGVLGGRA